MAARSVRNAKMANGDFPLATPTVESQIEGVAVEGVGESDVKATDEAPSSVNASLVVPIVCEGFWYGQKTLHRVESWSDRTPHARTQASPLGGRRLKREDVKLLIYDVW